MRRIDSTSNLTKTSQTVSRIGSLNSSPPSCGPLTPSTSTRQSTLPPPPAMTLALLAASAASGALSRCVVHPLDTLRARLMASHSPTTLFACARRVLASDGVRGLYRGFGVSVVMQAPAISTFLTTYERAKAPLADFLHVTPRHPGVHLAAGIAAETVSAVFWVPMEVVKQRAQVRGASSAVVARDLLRHEGARAFFKGYALTVGVFGPYSMIYFVTYERLKDWWGERLGTGEDHAALPLGAVTASASMSGAVAGALTCPLDIVKTRLQTQGDVAVAGQVRRQYSSTWHAVRSIAKEDGARGFLRGISARVLWLVPGTAITMTSFEYLKKNVVKQ